MGKFSELPYFLLDDYFSESVSTSNEELTPITNSYLHGGRSSIVADGGYWEKIWINIKSVRDGNDPEYPGMVEYKFRVDRDDYSNGDYFNFTDLTLITMPASANGTFDWGSEVYFKKGSYIYEWLLNNLEYKNYFNTNKRWLYFGKIYLRPDDRYHIIFDGLKNFVVNCLPPHQRTTNLTEFIRLYFDLVHHKIYNMTKNLSTMLDPKEIDINWIEYLTQNYNMDCNINFRDDTSLREWTESLANLLKRKGTYSSLYIIWKIFLKNTSNNLNIYNRWHLRNLLSFFGIRYPLGNFYDVLHQVSYGYLPTGCSGDWWYKKTFRDLATHYIFQQKAVSSTWEVRHEMYTKNIVVQCYDTSYNRIWPSKIEAVHFGRIDISFGEPVMGYAFLESDPDYVHSQNDSSVEWSIAHNLNDPNKTISQYQTLLYNTILPDNINVTNDNVTSVNFSELQDGYGLVLGDSSIITQSVASSAWSVNHGLNNREVLVQTFDMSDNMIQANEIHLEDENNCTITWSEPTSGYAVVRSVYQESTLPDWTEKILSPHYKVEIDLSCEPLDDDDDTPKIISEETIDGLIRKWEEMRPVTRFSHYHELISPITNFNGAYTSLYGGYNSYLFTKYCAESDEFIPAASADEMVFNQYSHSNKWSITHNFNSRNIIVQCYDRDNNRIWPKTITGKYNNLVEIEFDASVNGTAALLSLSTSGEVYTETGEYSSTWLINHSRTLKEVITQYDSTSYEKMVPSDIELVDSSNLIATWTTYKKGMGLISNCELIYAETEAKSLWYIDHRLGCDSIIALFFDDDDKQIEPDSVTLETNNRIVVRFAEATSGYCLIRSINKAFLESDVMDSISYWTLGCGTSGSDFDPVANNSVNSFLASGTASVSGSANEYDMDDDYYYLDLETGQQDEDWDITEIAWFDKNNRIRFYTYCSPIHKPKDVWFNSHLRIVRSQF
jgi:hypothetical protein